MIDQAACVRKVNHRSDTPQRRLRDPTGTVTGTMAELSGWRNAVDRYAGASFGGSCPAGGRR